MGTVPNTRLIVKISVPDVQITPPLCTLLRGRSSRMRRCRAVPRATPVSPRCTSASTSVASAVVESV